MKTNISLPSCTIDTALHVIGGKWKLVILWFVSQETQRFSTLKRNIPIITTKMLTQQLRELEHDGIIIRKVYPVVPPKVEYRLSEHGWTLLPSLKMLDEWGKQHQAWIANS